MEHPLSITTSLGTDRQGHQLRSGITTVMAETNLGPSPQLGFPESFAGRLVRLTPQLFNQLKFGHDAGVGFEGKRYKFSRLEKDGSFELQSDS